MKREIPLLTITLQVPLVPGLEVEDVLQAISQTIGEALERIQGGGGALVEAQAEEETGGGDRLTTISEEQLEPYTENTRPDLLTGLGYTAQE